MSRGHQHPSLVGRPLQDHRVIGRAKPDILDPHHVDVYLSAEGTDVELEWVVGPGAIGQQSMVQISMAAVGTEYHRWDGKRDGLAMFNYRVLPPDSQKARDDG